MKKKQIMSRMTAILLAVCMVSGVIPTTTFAAEPTAEENNISQEQIDATSDNELSQNGSEIIEKTLSSSNIREIDTETNSDKDQEQVEKSNPGQSEKEEVISVVTQVSKVEPKAAIATATVSSVNRINVQAAESGVYELMEKKYASKNVEVELVYNEDSATGDIVVVPTGSSDVYGDEGYSIEIANGIVTVTASTNNGAVYGLHDVLHQMEVNKEVSSIDATQPYKETRALFVDTARKYFGISWFEEIIREMSWNGLNTLYISFSNDEGFRLLLDDMSLSFDDGNGNTVSYDHEFMAHMVDNPEKVSDSTFLTERNASATDEGSSRVVTNYDNNKYYTQDDMERILAYAKAYGITVIPEFNSPGHFGQVLWYFPEYRIQGTWYEDGQPHYGLDLTNAEAYNFGQTLVKKYIDFFSSEGCTAFCVGGDEYDEGNAKNDQIAAYTNMLVEYAEGKGMTAYSWNDGQAASNNLLKDTAIVNCWNGVSNYSLINFDSQSLYYVLKTDRVWKPNAQTLFESWCPNLYNNTTDLSARLEGASLAIWCDVPNNETPAYILESIIPSINSFGYKMWNYSETATTSLSSEYASYSEFVASVTPAPYVAEKTVLESVGYDTTNMTEELPEPTTESAYKLVTLDSSAPEPQVKTNRSWYQDSGSKAVDGDIGTVAWTAVIQSVGDYIQVDLGTVQSIDVVTVTSAANDVCPEAVVEVSLDESSWKSVGTHMGSSGSVTEHSVDQEIRYIRVRITTPDTSKWWQLAEISWTPRKDIIENGTYIIVNETNKAMTNKASKNTNGNATGFASEDVEINGDVATPINKMYEWTFTRQSDGTYYITDCDGKWLNIDNKNVTVTVTNTPQSIMATIDNNGKVQLSYGNYAINYYASEGKIYSRYNTSNTDENNYQTLYKKYTEEASIKTQELYNAITTAQGLKNNENKYGANEFEELQKVLSESIELYLAASTEDTTVTQEQIDAQVDALNDAINALKLSDRTQDFIEIPIDILDFRADGVMFEYVQNTNASSLYELLTDTKDWGRLYYAKNYVPMPGETGDRITTDEWHVSAEYPQGWFYDCKRIGLVEHYLVDGAPVYKEATVDYVAKLIAKGYFKDYSPSIEHWNDNISDKITDLNKGYDATSDTNSNLGTWDDTLSKTSTETNGGKLTWASITTCYDLAYYILNNMWRSTETTDGEDTYNKLVDERNTMRLIADKDGYYWFDSTKAVTYNNQYMYNEDLTTENTEETKFTPINGLGYESGNKFGDTTDTTTGINYHFTAHARAYFVYHADDNLYFYFDGDDDVYFYVNEQLVMDIGGAHSHCDDELYLNTVAESLGLVEGGIYSFDMFYADRHTTQTNLSLKTNIKIMDTASVTTKEQYNVTAGSAIPYGGIVTVGDEVAYSFNLMNLRSVNISNIVFEDEELGTYLSKDEIKLYDASKTNGVVTNLEDITVYYHTYDRSAPSEEGVINSSTPIAKTVSEMLALINEANTNVASLATGSYEVKISTTDDLKALLSAGIPYDVQMSVSGVKRIATEDDRPYINTLNTSATYEASGKRMSVYGTAKQKLTVFNSFELPVLKKTAVIDYGKKVQIPISDVTNNIKANDGVSVEFYGITGRGAHSQILTVNTAINGIKLDTEYASIQGNGIYYLRDTNTENGNTFADTIEFNLGRFLSEVERFYAVYQITDVSLDETEYKTYYLMVEVDIIPATMMYYETDFTDNAFTFNDVSKWNGTKVNGINNVVDDIQNSGTSDPDVYGYDSTYADEEDSAYSDYHSYVVTGEGSTTTTVNFSFKGTGFDLISSTGEEEGFIRVSVYSDAGKTTLEKRVTVLNKSESELTLYQIPVVSIEGLSYGNHYVEIGVSAPKSNASIEALNNGGKFHFDAIRIYNPIDVSDGYMASGDSLAAYEAYVNDSEANMELKEVRNMLIAADSFDVSDTDTEGVVFVDRDPDGVTIADYKTIGPNNEVYLGNDQAIGFKLNVNQIPTSIDVGAKSADGKPVMLTASIFSVDKTTNEVEYNLCRTYTAEIVSATAQFYDLFATEGTTVYTPAEVFGDGKSIFVYVANIGEGILSITDVKVAFGENGGSYTVTSDKRSLNKMIEIAGGVIEEEETAKNYDIIDAVFTPTTVKRNTDAVMTVVTSELVENLVLLNKAGREQKISVKAEIDDNGNKIWTVSFKATILGKHSYTVTGYGADGMAGTPMTADVTVTIR